MRLSRKTTMIDYLATFATDERSIAIAVIGLVCWLIKREGPSVHAMGGLFVFVLVFSLFVMWRYAPTFAPTGLPDLANASRDDLLLHIAQLNGAYDVLWRQMEMYVFSVHFTALVYLSWVFFLEREIFARMKIGRAHV